MTVHSRPRFRRLSTVVVALTVAALAISGCRSSGDSNGSTEGKGSGNVPGVTADSIKIGGSFPFSGGLAAFGALSQGLDAYFKQVNAEGGVNGREIVYNALDDGYDPSRVSSNARKLVEGEQVFAFVGFGGTNLAIRDYMKGNGVPQFVMAGNAPLSNIEEYPTTRAWWPDIRLEAGIAAHTVLERNPDAKIGGIGLNNDITASQVEGIKLGLGEHKDQLITVEKYPPTANDFSSQINRLRAAGVDTWISGIGGTDAITAFKYMAQIGYDPEIYNYSGATGIIDFLGKVGELGKGIHCVMWTKDPADPQWADDEELTKYREAIKKYGKGADPDDPLVLNGYGFGAALVDVLKTMDNPTREGLLEAWDNVKDLDNPALVPGATLNAGPDGRLVHNYRLATWNGTTWKFQGDVVDALKIGILDY